MKNIIKLFLILIVLFSISFGQTLTRDDFKVGAFDLDKPINSIIQKYGTPTHKSYPEGDTAYSYKNFTVWVNESDNKINAFQIINSDFALTRCINIGDSLSKIIRLFKTPDEIGIKFERLVGPYDLKFSNYSSFVKYYFKTDKYEPHFDEYYHWYIVFYLKEDKVVRVLYYKGIFE